MPRRGLVRLAAATVSALAALMAVSWGVRANPQWVAAAVDTAHAAHLSPYTAVVFRREVATPYPATTVKDQRLPAGLHEVLRPGQSGLVLETGVAFYRAAEPAPAARAAGTTAAAAGPVDVKVFTRNPLRAPRPATLALGTARDLVQVGGRFYRYIRVLNMVATAYDSTRASNGPYTGEPSTIGVALNRGVVAVDPHVIPLGTWLYVQGYGLAVAADTGSAIVGDRIDLFFWNTPAGIAAFGIRRLRVYVLDDPQLPPVPVSASIRNRFAPATTASAGTASATSAGAASTATASAGAAG